MGYVHMDEEDLSNSGNVDPQLIARWQDARAVFLSGDTDRAIELLKQLAADGLSEANHVLGNIYLQYPSNEQPDLAAAFEYFQAAVNAGVPSAYSSLETDSKRLVVFQGLASRLVSIRI
jgi:TPR repeat protein